MARRVFCFLLVQGCVLRVLSIYAQPTIQQYLHLTGSPLPTHTVTVPATQPTARPANIGTNIQPKPATGLPTLSALALPELLSRLQQLSAVQQTAPTTQVANLPRPTSELSLYPGVALPNLVSGFQQIPRQRPAEVKTANPSCVDSNVLNNLAIALQLLIVSNILNAPPPLDSSIAKQKDVSPCVEPNPYYSQAQTVMPNSNFVGSSGFSEPNVAQVYKPTRNSMSLMSPYEALASNSPYSEPIMNQQGPSNSRQGFQSPYSMMTNNDLFSMNDLF